MALAKVFEQIAGPDAPVEFRAYDGSEAGVAGAPVRITIRSPVALSYIAQAPGELGLARAYVSGHLDVDGDMYTALARMAHAQRVHLDLSERLRVLGELGGHGASGFQGAPDRRARQGAQVPVGAGHDDSVCSGAASSWRFTACD